MAEKKNNRRKPAGEGTELPERQQDQVLSGAEDARRSGRSPAPGRSPRPSGARPKRPPPGPEGEGSPQRRQAGEGPGQDPPGPERPGGGRRPEGGERPGPPGPGAKSRPWAPLPSPRPSRPGPPSRPRPRRRPRPRKRAGAGRKNRKSPPSGPISWGASTRSARTSLYMSARTTWSSWTAAWLSPTRRCWG